MTAEYIPINTSETPFTEHLASVVRTDASGTLVTTCDGVERTFIFENGKLNAVRSSEESEKIGSWLVSRGVISDGHRALALLSQSGSGSTKIGELLVGKNRIDEETLRDEIRKLWLAIAHRAAEGQNTKCQFNEEDFEDHTNPLTSLTPTKLLLVASRAYDNPEEKLLALGSLDQSVWPAASITTLLAEINLTPTEGFLLSRLTSTETIKNMVRISSLPENTVINALYTLQMIGAINTGPTPLPVPSKKKPSSISTRKITSKKPTVDESSLTEAQLAERISIKEAAEEVNRLDHYSALGITNSATHEEIEQALKAQIRRFSAARQREAHLADLKDQFKAIIDRSREAHELLSHPKSRRRYDRVVASVEEDEKHMDGQTVKKDTDPGARKAIVEANFTRARELAAEGEIHLAIKLLDHACKLEPRPSELVNLARLLVRNPQWANRAVDHLQRATEIDPFYVDAWIELAEHWRRRSHGGRQRLALERALRSDPENERAQSMYRFLCGKKELQRFLEKLA